MLFLDGTNEWLDILKVSNVEKKLEVPVPKTKKWCFLAAPRFYLPMKYGRNLSLGCMGTFYPLYRFDSLEKALGSLKESSTKCSIRWLNPSSVYSHLQSIYRLS